MNWGGGREIGEIGSRIRTDQDNFKLSSLWCGKKKKYFMS